MAVAVKLTQGAASVLSQLRAQGADCTDTDVIEINALCAEIEMPQARRQLAKGTPHLLCGDIWLWPLTIAGYDWLDRIGYDLPDDLMAMGYAMAHGHSEAITTATWQDVKTWRRRLAVTRAQLQAVVDAVLEQSERARHIGLHNEGEPAYGDYVIAAMRAHGGTAEQWQFMVSLSFISDLLHTAAMQASAGDADARSLAKQDAQTALAQKLWEIKKRGKA